MKRPLDGVRVIELGGIGPGPHAGMLLVDLGAEVVRIERPEGGLTAVPDPGRDVVLRGRTSVSANLRDPRQASRLLGLIDHADVLIDGFRPGVTDRLGVGPETVMRRNPRLVYARMTGWGADGPLAPRAGHDLNYLALTGVLHAIRTTGARPTPPLNLIGDYGGGSLYLVVGILAGLYQREASGRGQLVDAAIVDGVLSLAQMIWAMRAQGQWSDEPASNLLDSGAPFYDTYECADGRFVAVAAMEPQFYAQLLEGLDLSSEDLPQQHDPDRWPELRDRLAATFLARTREEWTDRFEGTDACVTPVLSFGEAVSHPHLVARRSFAHVDGIPHAAPAPRFSGSRQTAEPMRPPPPGESTLDEVYEAWAVG